MRGWSERSKTDNEDYLLVADTLGVNRSTARGIDLFTDTAAILNLFWDLRSIMGCPGGTRSVFTRAFWAKRELHMISREKGDHYYFQTWHTIFFFPLQSFIGKLKAPKVWLRRNAGHFPPIPPYFPFLPNAFRHQLRRLQADQPDKTFLCSCYSLYSNHLYGVTPLFSIVQFALDIFN